MMLVEALICLILVSAEWKSLSPGPLLRFRCTFWMSQLNLVAAMCSGSFQLFTELGVNADVGLCFVYRYMYQNWVRLDLLDHLLCSISMQILAAWIVLVHVWYVWLGGIAQWSQLYFNRTIFWWLWFKQSAVSSMLSVQHVASQVLNWTWSSVVNAESCLQSLCVLSWEWNTGIVCVCSIVACVLLHFSAVLKVLLSSHQRGPVRPSTSGSAISTP
jgi:hypothetical protein